jgi:hypothetical protein
MLFLVGAGAWPAAVTQAAPGWDACAMIRPADLDTAFAPRRFEPGTPGARQVAGTSTLATVSDCTFVSRGATAKEKLTVSLLARRAPSDATGVTPAVARAGAVQLKATPADVAGLGEGAYWVNLGSASFPVVELNLFRGKRDWLILSGSGRSLDVKSTVEGLTKAARSLVLR